MRNILRGVREFRVGEWRGLWSRSRTVVVIGLSQRRSYPWKRAKRLVRTNLIYFLLWVESFFVGGMGVLNMRKII